MNKTSQWTLFAMLLLAGVALFAFAMAGHASPAAAVGGGGASLSQSVNAAIDNGLALADRILEFPLFILLLLSLILGILLALFFEFLTRRRRSARAGVPLYLLRIAFVAAGIVLLFALALLADRKIARLQAEVIDLRSKVNVSRMTAPTFEVPPQVTAVPNPLPALSSAAPATTPALTKTPPSTAPVLAQHTPPSNLAAQPASRAVPTSQPAAQRPLMFDPKDVQSRLAATFTGTILRPMVYDRATDAVDIHSTSPLAQAYLTITDLRTPGLQVQVGGSLDTKTLTSAFARANNCALAINGEAGQSPRMNSGFGPWHGYLMNQGQLLLREDPANRRPFLAFDKQNLATFRPIASADRALPATSFNVIWGRLDALIDGQVQTADERNRQPRTAMGIDRDGTHLFLMVVDGRQQGYSLGYTRAEVGALLKAFGAWNGMLCDEGGSSCMVTSRFGLVNAPSDGEERPTYTHFGIALSDSPASAAPAIPSALPAVTQR